MENKIVCKPAFYDEFYCIADRCDFTCCQEWKISLDQETRKIWETNPVTAEHIEEKQDMTVIALDQNHKCPFLNEKKLCRLVLQYGEGILSHTCHTFPRQSNYLKNRQEESMVVCCPAVVDAWKKCGKIQFIETCQGQETLVSVPGKTEESQELLKLRALFIQILQEGELSLGESMNLIFFILLDYAEQQQKDAKGWENKRKQYEDGAYQKELAETLRRMKFHEEDTLQERNELFLDMVENYRREGLYLSYIEPVAKLAEAWSADYHQVECSMDVASQLNSKTGFLREYEDILRNYLISEIYTNSVIEDADLDSMLQAMEWIALEYAITQQALLLKWKSKGGASLEYKEIRDYLVLIGRITGYNQEDIEEFLENSFDSPVWDWGYFALLMYK